MLANQTKKATPSSSDDAWEWAANSLKAREFRVGWVREKLLAEGKRSASVAKACVERGFSGFLVEAPVL